jgi:hypothetical protein
MMPFLILLLCLETVVLSDILHEHLLMFLIDHVIVEAVILQTLCFIVVAEVSFAICFSLKILIILFETILE